MQATPPGGQAWNQCKWHYMLAKFGTNTSGTTCWPNLEVPFFLAGDIAQVIESIPWVRCASGNVFAFHRKSIMKLKTGWDQVSL